MSTATNAGVPSASTSVSAPRYFRLRTFLFTTLVACATTLVIIALCRATLSERPWAVEYTLFKVVVGALIFCVIVQCASIFRYHQIGVINGSCIRAARDVGESEETVQMSIDHWWWRWYSFAVLAGLISSLPYINHTLQYHGFINY